MIFTKALRDGVRRGQITCSVRIWQRPHVTAGKRYRMEEGEIEVDSILPISLADITPELARASGFKGVVDLLKVAKHGRGENVYLGHVVASAAGSRSGLRESSLRAALSNDGRPTMTPFEPTPRKRSGCGPASGQAERRLDAFTHQ